MGSTGPDYCYSCDICNERMPNYMSVVQHRKSIHHIGNKRLQMIQQADKESDIHNRNLFCKLCQVTYDNELSHTQHMKYAHYMVSKLSLRETTTRPETDIVSDADNTTDLPLCKSCKRNTVYEKHRMKPFKILNQEDIVDTFAYCKPCNKQLVDKHSYRSHVLGIHGINWKQLMQQKRKDVMPDANDPNFYCRSCEKKLSSKYSLKIHLNIVHSMFQPSRTDNLNMHCQACQKAYPSKSKDCTHICVVNQTALPALETQGMPDPHDPHYFCRVCKLTYSSRGYYRIHCRISHCMMLGHSSIVNSTAKININDPNFYCAQCEHAYSSSFSFRKHLLRVHNQ